VFFLLCPAGEALGYRQKEHGFPLGFGSMVEDLPSDGWPVAGTEEHYRNWLVSVRSA
jgi:hypothetical protein